jgi:hypothetical protein
MIVDKLKHLVIMPLEWEMGLNEIKLNEIEKRWVFNKG